MPPPSLREDTHAFLVRLGEALRPLRDPLATQAEAARLLGQHLGVNRATCAEIDGGWAVIRGQYVNGVASLPARVALAGFGEPLLAECRAGALITIEDARTDPRTATVRGAFDALQLRALVAVPLVIGGEWVAIFGVDAAAPRAWTVEERALVGEVAERTWAAAQQLRAEAALRESEARHRQLFELLDDGVTIVELIRDAAGAAIDWRYLFANAALERQEGLRPEAVVGRRGSEVLADDYRAWLPTLVEVVETQRPVRLDPVSRTLGRIASTQIFPYGRDRCASLSHDVTARAAGEAAQRTGTARQAYLLKLADALRALDDPDAIRYEAACVLGEHLGVTRAYYADVDPQGGTIDVARNWTSKGASSIAGRYPFSTFAWIGPAFAAGRVVAVDDVASSPLIPEASRPALAAIDAGAFIVAPQITDGRLVAALSVVQREPRAWLPYEVELVEETSRRAWAAVEHARADTARDAAKNVLEHRIVERTAQLAASHEALEHEVDERRQAEQQVKQLFRRLASTQEAERQRVARDMHDQVGQQMTALRMFLDGLLVHAVGNDALRAGIDRTRRLAEDLDRSIEFITWQLRPSSVGHLGLAASLRDLVRGWTERFGIAAEFESVAPAGLRLAPEVEEHLYRLTQEALHNVLKHAQAQHVSVVLSRRNGVAMLAIEDDGRGFELPDSQSAAAGHQLGLISMRERATLVGGELEIDSQPGRGTTIFVRVPAPVA